ncbi:hypothetical protein D3C72_2290930 [compost metagenome]
MHDGLVALLVGAVGVQVLGPRDGIARAFAHRVLHGHIGKISHAQFDDADYQHEKDRRYQGKFKQGGAALSAVLAEYAGIGLF